METVVLGMWGESDKPELLCSWLRGRTRALVFIADGQRRTIGQAHDFRVQYHAGETWLVCSVEKAGPDVQMPDIDDGYSLREDMLPDVLMLEESRDTDVAGNDDEAFEVSQ